MVRCRLAPRALRPAISVVLLAACALSAATLRFEAATASAASLPGGVILDTGAPDGRMAMASRPESAGKTEIEAADDFLLTAPTQISNASFVGLLPSGQSLSGIGDVVVEIYRVFPLDSTNPPSGNVPTRANSPSDVASVARKLSTGSLTATATLLSASFTVANSVLNGIHPKPNQTTGGEGPVTGEEVRVDVTFTPAIALSPDHYFIVPEVQLSSASANFSWLSAPHTGTLFTPDLQTWIRNDNLDPDWLRVGTDIVRGSPAPQFNGAFSLQGAVIPSPTPTATRTPTITPTPTRTPTITPTPFPHPNVGVQVAPSGGTLQTTLTARDAGCSANNQLQSLTFTRLTNATVDVATSPVTHVAAPTTLSLPAHPASIGLTVRRTTAGQAATVELTVTDGCGAWPTFVGGGASAF
ncbi:MAG TPA: hypothetical protein VII06_43725 [Chloroflexota bacterium]|jgi:hypothetical protein